MQLWQLDTIAVDDKFKALYNLCEEQESTIEDLRYELEEAVKKNKGLEIDAKNAETLQANAEEERDEFQKKLDAVKAMLEEVDDMGCGLDYINEILDLL